MVNIALCHMHCVRILLKNTSPKPTSQAHTLRGNMLPRPYPPKLSLPSTLNYLTSAPNPPKPFIDNPYLEPPSSLYLSLLLLAPHFPHHLWIPPSLSCHYYMLKCIFLRVILYGWAVFFISLLNTKLSCRLDTSRLQFCYMAINIGTSIALMVVWPGLVLIFIHNSNCIEQNY